MDEIGLGIVADTAEFQIQAGLTQLAGIAPGQADVDGAPQHVVAERGHAFALFAQQGIGLGGAVTGDDVIGRTVAQPAVHGKEQIQQPRIHGFDGTGTVIP